MTKIIALIGDSTLDNIFWTRDEPDCVERRLQSMMVEGDVVLNLAVDGFTTTDVLNGAFRDKAVKSKHHPHKRTKPLEVLQQTSHVTDVVLSVGGNNVREQLPQLAQVALTQKIDDIKALITGITQEITADLIQILTQIKKLKPEADVTLMLQYTPDINNDIYNIYAFLNLLAYQQNSVALATAMGLGSLDPVPFLHHMMSTIYRPVLEYAAANNIPVIDMASSFDHTDTSLYLSQIEPSAKGSVLISQLIQSVVYNHDYSGPSIIYHQSSRTNKVTKRANPEVDVNANKKYWHPIAIDNAETSPSSAPISQVVENSQVAMFFQPRPPAQCSEANTADPDVRLSGTAPGSDTQ